MAGILAQLVLMTLLASAPPLTEAQRMQLDSARDTLAQTDEGALYPLLENALLWPANLQAGATIPDYAAIQANPASHRGELFLIEGTLRRARPIGKLALPGPWEGSLSEWTIQYGNEPEKMLVVNLVAPPGEPKDGTDVRLAARFYKLWVTTNSLNQPRTYMVFVGRDATIVSAPRAFALNGEIPVSVLALVLCVGVFALIWVIRRTPKMTFNPAPTAWQQRRRRAQELQEQAAARRAVRDSQAAEQATPPVDVSSLPKDPAQALAQLDTRDAQKTDSSTTPDVRE